MSSRNNASLVLGKSNSPSVLLSQYAKTTLSKKTGNVSTTAEQKFSYKKLIKRVVLMSLIVIISVGGWLGWKVYADTSKITGDNNPLQLLSIFSPSQLDETNGNVNVLLAGYSVDDPGHQGAELTDSIMIVSFNPKTKKAAMISVPRDTWVNIPGFGYEKINAAYEDGEEENFSQSGYPNGGMGLLEEVVQQNFGITSNYYGLLDYTAFQDAVNAVGGVTVDIQSPDSRGLYDPYTNLNLPNGEDSLDGQQALNLARARGDGPGAYGFPDGDFDRTEHQQQLLVALKTKASSTSVITNPLKIASLLDAVGNNFKTNMSVGVMETLYDDSRGVSDGNIQSVTLNNYQGQDLLVGYTASDGEDVLIPSAGFDDFSQIQSVTQAILNSLTTTDN
jgi:LCP family protein required for cell wall assembly